MRYAMAAVLAFVSSVLAFSQDSEQFRACNEKAKVQLEINQCASQEADRVDAQLNKVYGQLLSRAAGEPNAVAKIKAAERAWITYRDAYIEAMYPASDKRAEYGSMYPMDVALLRARLTQRHLIDLEELLKEY